MKAFGAALAIWLLAGCDSRATASDPGSRSDLKSKEYESCSASAQCADELRCFEQTCRRTARSAVGDYYAASAAIARGKGDLEAAIAGYGDALNRYDSEKMALPPDIDCAYGQTLAAAKARKEHAELAAHVLHRCMLAVPTGSKLREQALIDLAGLADAGLDPALLGSNKIADLYLVKAPSRPAADKAAVTVTFNPAVAGNKTLPLVIDKLAEPDPHAALIACWSSYTDASKKDTLNVAIGVKIGYVPSDYDDEQGTFSVKLDPPAGLAAGSPEAAADACVRQVVDPALKAVKLADPLATRLAITIK